MHETTASLFPTQLDFIKSEHKPGQCYKHPALVAGLGYGKTTTAVYKALDLANSNRGFMGAMYMPTHDLINTVLIPKFEELGLKHNIPLKIDHSATPHIDIRFADGSVTRILLRSMTHPERIVGYELAWAICDEIDTIPLVKALDIWRRIQGRVRIGVFRQIAVVGSPESLNFLFELWENNPPSPHYKLYRASSLENPYLPDDYFQTMYDSYGEKAIQAYIHGKFVNLHGETVYDAFDRKRHVKTLDQAFVHAPMGRRFQYYTGTDFGWANPSSILFGKVYNNHMYIYNEYERSQFKLWDFLDASLGKMESPSLADWCDPSGKKNLENAPQTNLQIMQSKGMHPKFLIANIMEGVNVVNNLFEKDRLHIHPRCTGLIDCLESNSRTFDSKGNWVDFTQHDKHAVDALRYMCYGVFGRQSELFKTEMVKHQY